MLRIDRDGKRFIALGQPTLADVSITERYDLQEFIANSPDAFFKELGLDLFVVGKEIVPSEDVQDRIDLLCLDKEGAAVIVELKRGNHKLHMMQAISYAGMISAWTADAVQGLLDEDGQEALSEFLDVSTDEVNRTQRVVLIAEGYDYALLSAAEWLNQQYGVPVSCCRVSMATDEGSGAEYLVCSNVYPAPELAQQAVPRGRAKAIGAKPRYSDWDSALAEVRNPTEIKWFRKWASEDREMNPRYRILHARIRGKRRIWTKAHRDNAYAWQRARFEGDEQYWRGGLSSPDEVVPVKNGQCLRFFLKTDADFLFFEKSIDETLKRVTWIARSESGPFDDDVGEDE